jgi:hypothetical protein
MYLTPTLIHVFCLIDYRGDFSSTAEGEIGDNSEYSDDEHDNGIPSEGSPVQDQT